MNPSIETLKKMPNGTPFFLQNQINVNQKTFYNNTREYLGDKNENKKSVSRTKLNSSQCRYKIRKSKSRKVTQPFHM